MSNETIALSTIEAARELRVHPNTLLRWVAQGKSLTFVGVGENFYSHALKFNALWLARILHPSGWNVVSW